MSVCKWLSCTMPTCNVVCSLAQAWVGICSGHWNSFENKPHPLPCNNFSQTFRSFVSVWVCCLFRDCHPSQHQSIPTSVCRGMVIHSSHMQIVAVRLGRPWERIKASGLGCPSILLSSLPTIPPPPPLHLPLPAALCCYPTLTHLPLLPWADVQSLGCVGCWVKRWRAV